MITIHEEEVHHVNSSNMLEERNIMLLEKDEHANQPILLPLYETKYDENFEINEEGIACAYEVIVEISMELDKELILLEDKEFKKVSLTTIHVENYYDRNEHDALMS